jgi:hypothetical protein
MFKTKEMKTEPTEALKKLHEDTAYNVTGYKKAREAVNIAFQEGQSSPKIRQLEWEDTDMWYFKAKTSLGLGYSITEIKGTYIVHFGDAPISWEKSLESAKAAAQADFEKRINECLE